jgi:hypothetical protein
MRAKEWVSASDAAIERAWIEAASRCGFHIVRSEAAYASTDGNGTIVIGEPHTLDDDDSLAQLVLHELCHALVQGEASWRARDWGLDNTSDRDDVREEACLRLQAHFCDRHGLRAALEPTTEWRAYFRALPAEPLRGGAGPRDEEASALAWAGAALAERRGWGGVLGEALAATARQLGAGAAAGVATAGEGGRHPLGWGLGPRAESCGSCAWRYLGGRGAAVERCRQSVGEVGDGQRIEAAFPACERWERPVDCFTCGACCREAYHTVTVSMRDPVVWKQPGLVARSGHRFSILRSGDRCAALEREDAGAGARYRCSIYDDRPRTCRDFEQGGRHCLVARRRVGLSR